VILTTSRKPSRKTRSLSKVLSSFMNWEYVNRGKMSLEELHELGKFAIIEEIKGNPAILRVFESKEEVLSLKFSPGIIKKTKMDDSPVFFVGKVWFDPSVLEAVPLNRAGEKLKKKMRLRESLRKEVIFGRRNGRKYFNFRYEGKTVIVLYIRE